MVIVSISSMLIMQNNWSFFDIEDLIKKTTLSMCSVMGMLILQLERPPENTTTSAKTSYLVMLRWADLNNCLDVKREGV